MQREYPAIQFKKEVRAGDFKEALWVQYMNCINSLNTLESASISQSGQTLFQSAPSWAKFEGNVKILYSLCDGYGLLDDDFKNKAKKADEAAQLFADLTGLLKRKVFSEKVMDLGHV